MTDELTFDELLAKLRSGDDDAARQVFEQYARRLIGLAQMHLNSAVRRKMDAEDVVQSVFKSFFVRMGKGEFSLERMDNLWSLLALITLRKCGQKVRYLRRQSGDIRREAEPRQGDDSTRGFEASTHGPTPAEAAIMAETVEQLFASLKDRERQIVELHLQGYEVAEIQEQVQRAEYTVRDVLTRVRKRLERECENKDAAE